MLVKREDFEKQPDILGAFAPKTEKQKSEIEKALTAKARQEAEEGDLEIRVEVETAPGDATREAEAISYAAPPESEMASDATKG
ncbi:hypothetical protein MMC25_001497 [Agyrium rufum]|nr:hypothetical protein [Agyrium rufum]